MTEINSQNRIQIKICGLTAPEPAAACARLGADAVGLVFFPRSPRDVTPDKARDIVSALPPRVLPVGVFVNAGLPRIMDVVEKSGVRGVQLHGQEPPGLVTALKKEGLKVYKALFVAGDPGAKHAENYPADAFLVECAEGPLPGGNAITWDWGAVRDLPDCRPLILAGGLSPHNVTEAIAKARPDAVDVSSGVEAAPGIKDLEKVERFIAAVRSAVDLREAAVGKVY